MNKRASADQYRRYMKLAKRLREKMIDYPEDMLEKADRVLWKIGEQVRAHTVCPPLCVNVGAYTVLPVTIVSKGGEGKKNFEVRKTKNPDAERKSWVSVYHYLFFKDNRTGLTWAFVGTRRSGELRFSDSRDVVTDTARKSRERLSMEELRKEVKRLTKTPSLVDDMMTFRVDGKDIKDELDPWRSEIAMGKIHVRLQKEKRNAYHKKRRPEVGLKVPLRKNPYHI